MRGAFNMNTAQSAAPGNGVPRPQIEFRKAEGALLPHVESYYVAVLWFGGLGLGTCANKLTLGRDA